MARAARGSLPEAHTDFIFAVLGEEFGLLEPGRPGYDRHLGYAGIRIASHADDLFVRFAAGGITTWFMVQALINLAVVLRMLPIAGCRCRWSPTGLGVGGQFAGRRGPARLRAPGT